MKQLFARLARRLWHGPLGKPMKVGIDGNRLPNYSLGPHAVWVQSLGKVRIDVGGSGLNFVIERRQKILGIIPWKSVHQPGTNDQTMGRAYFIQTRWMGVVTYTFVPTTDAKVFAGLVATPYGLNAKWPFSMFPMKVGYQDNAPKVPD